MKMKFLVLFILSLALTTQAAVWNSQNVWNADWEKKYSLWIQNEVKSDFFKVNKIRTDCADAAIALRWVFSRINSLPAASNLPSGKLVTNLTMNWDQSPTSSVWQNDARFLKALSSINNETSTSTMLADVYPVKLNSENLLPGTLFVNSSKASGHAEWISQIDFNGMNNPITFSASTVPIAIRDVLVYPFMKTKWPKQNENGFFRFRWAEKQTTSTGTRIILREKNSMPGYSLEQYQLSVNLSKSTDFDDFVTERLIGQPLDGMRKLQNLASHLIHRFETRTPVVEQGYKACFPNKCKTDSDIFYGHSTYARDTAIQFLIIGITELIYSDKYIKNVDDEIAGQMVLRWSQLQSTVYVEMMGKQIYLGELVSKWNQNSFSSDPNNSIERRWGF